jgi:hypothetical protein
MRAFDAAPRGETMIMTRSRTHGPASTPVTRRRQARGMAGKRGLGRAATAPYPSPEAPCPPEAARGR